MEGPQRDIGQGKAGVRCQNVESTASRFSSHRMPIHCNALKVLDVMKSLGHEVSYRNTAPESIQLLNESFCNLFILFHFFF